MPADHVPNSDRVLPFGPRPGSHHLVVCSVCLRVQEGGAWIEAGEVIRRLRTFEQEDVARLRGALCERCRTERRRRRSSYELAA